MAASILLFRLSKIIYDEYNEHKAFNINKNIENLKYVSFKERLSKIDIKYVNSLIEIVKKEMKEMKESSYKPSLSVKERKVIIEYCYILLEGYDNGYIHDFSKERRDYCNEIIKYCNDPSDYRIVYVFLN